MKSVKITILGYPTKITTDCSVDTDLQLGRGTVMIIGENCKWMCSKLRLWLIMVRVRDMGVGFTMKTQIANGFVAMRDRKTQQRERFVHEGEKGGRL